MGNFVTMGAMLQCSFGMAPCSLIVTVPLRPKCMNMLMAAMGVLTPMPCVPVIAAPWAPGSAQVKVMNMPALTDNSKCMCSFGGNISITSPGNTMVSGK